MTETKSKHLLPKPTLIQGYNPDHSQYYANLLQCAAVPGEHSTLALTAAALVLGFMSA